MQQCLIFLFYYPFSWNDVIKTKLGGADGRGGYEIQDKINMRRTSYAGEASSRSCLPSGES